MLVFRPGYKNRYNPPLRIEEEEAPEAQAAMNGNSGNEEPSAPTETPSTVKETNRKMQQVKKTLTKWRNQEARRRQLKFEMWY